MCCGNSTKILEINFHNKILKKSAIVHQIIMNCDLNENKNRIISHMLFESHGIALVILIIKY